MVAKFTEAVNTVIESYLCFELHFFHQIIFHKNLRKLGIYFQAEAILDD